jgi:hypothetical protein
VTNYVHYMHCGVQSDAAALQQSPGRKRTSCWSLAWDECHAIPVADSRSLFIYVLIGLQFASYTHFSLCCIACFIFFLCLLFFFIPSPMYSLLFSISTLIIFLFFRLSLFTPLYFVCLFVDVLCFLPTYRHQSQRNKNETRKEK